MDSDASRDVDIHIFQIYKKYCEIRSRSGCGGLVFQPDAESHSTKCSRDELSQLLKLVEPRVHICNSAVKELLKLMPHLDLMTNFSEFSRFYDFVFFICRENGQKNITVSKAVAAWRLVLSGRFRLLDQWCDFVEKNQRYNISEDTWQQVLAFSRCVDENLEGYDPEGAWPVLVDDFVEHMYRNFGSNGNPNTSCRCGDSEFQSCAYEDGLLESREDHGLKRKFPIFQGEENMESDILLPDAEGNLISNSKRSRSAGEPYSPMCTSKSWCVVERCLSKGFAGLLSSRPYLRFNRERRVRYR